MEEEPEPSPVVPEQPSSSLTAVEVTQPETGRKKRGKLRARPVTRPVSPRRTRAHSRSANPHDTLAASQTITRAKAKAAAAAATVPEPTPDSQVFDEFVAHSESDEGEMHEVEANLQVSVVSGGASLVTYRAFFFFSFYQLVLTLPPLFFLLFRDLTGRKSDP